MYCRQCGAEIPEGTKFCVKCGARVDGDGSASSPGTVSSTKPVALPQKWLYWGIGAGVLAIVVLVYLLLPLGPEAVAQRFLEALKEERWDQAYSYLYVGNEKGAVLGKEQFRKAMEALNAGGKITEVSLDTQEAFNKFGNQVMKAVGNMGGQLPEGEFRLFLGHIARGKNSSTLELQMLKGEKTGGRWKIDASSLTEARIVDAWPGVRVLVDGKDMGTSGGVTFTTFVGCPCEITFSHDDMKPQTVTTSKRTVAMHDPEPSDKLRKELMALVERYEAARMKMYRELNPDYCKEYSTDGLYGWWAQATTNWRNQGIYFEVKIEMGGFAGAQFQGSMERIHFDVDETWSWVEKKISDGSVVESRAPYPWQTRFQLEKHNGKWLVDGVVKR